ncbi:MAG: glutathione S-transferase family protein [Steroidobacteraceae bacterium]
MDIILHAYDASPFTQRALKLLAIKGLAWRWVETPMMPPKDDLVALTGGYRGTPVMQIGADVYVDSQRIARELERRHPSPSYFPTGDAGIGWALVEWADAYFRSGLVMAIRTTSAAWPAEFRADRQRLFPDIDFERADLEHARAQFRAYSGFIEAQLADGRAFLGGPSPGLADVHAWTVPWFARASIPGVNELLAAFPRMAAWEARVAALGEGRRTACTAGEAFAVARASTPAPGEVDPGDALGLAAGEVVEVVPDDTSRGVVRGAVHAADWNGISIHRTHPRCGEVVVHFPRVGYRVSRVAG